jgi:hypothetical protein
MIGWDRCGDSIIVVLSPRQIRWLRKQLTDYRNRVDRALSESRDDPVLAAVFTNFDDDFDLRLRRARRSITATLDSLPARGGVIEICGEPNRMTWIWTLQELRIAAAARLAASLPASTAGAGAPAKLQTWLLGIVETLVKAGDLPLVPNGPNNDFQPLQ